MIQKVPADSRVFVDLGWLQSYPSFSFGTYFDPDNTGFGVLRVCNADTVAPGKGFGPHPHSDMEIVTVVLKGSVRHVDNLGNAAITRAGEIQRMTAGSGMIHAEYNASDSEELSLLQLWFMPAVRGLPASYENVRYDAVGLTNALLPVVTPNGTVGTASIHQDLTLYLSRLDPGVQVVHPLENVRLLFLYVLEGRLTAGAESFGPGDTARIRDISRLELRAEEECFFMLIDMPGEGE